MSDEKKLQILYTGIGRERQFYLDGLVSALENLASNRPVIEINNAFRLSRGLSFSLWKLIDLLYRLGNQRGLAGMISRQICGRPDSLDLNPLTKALTGNIRHFYRDKAEPVVITEPLLVSPLASVSDVIYLHGNIAVPPQSIPRVASLILVPVDEARDRLVRSGIPDQVIRVTGLCIEQALVESLGIDFTKRLARIREKEKLVGAFYCSDTEPAVQVKNLTSLLNSLDISNQRGIVFCKAGGRLEKALMNSLSVRRFVPGKREERFHEAIAKSHILAVIYNDRKQIDSFTTDLFRYFDYLVSPANERSSWAAGLGIPMFIMNSLAGPSEKSNRNFLLRQGLAVDIGENNNIASFSNLLEEYRDSGKLLDLAASGYNKLPITGFKLAAEYIAEFFERTSRQ